MRGTAGVEWTAAETGVYTFRAQWKKRWRVLGIEIMNVFEWLGWQHCTKHKKTRTYFYVVSLRFVVFFFSFLSTRMASHRLAILKWFRGEWTEHVESVPFEFVFDEMRQPMALCIWSIWCAAKNFRTKDLNEWLENGRDDGKKNMWKSFRSCARWSGKKRRESLGCVCEGAVLWMNRDVDAATEMMVRWWRNDFSQVINWSLVGGKVL